MHSKNGARARSNVGWSIRSPIARKPILEAARSAPVTDRAGVESEAPFASEELGAHLRKNAAIYCAAGPRGALREIAAILENLALDSARELPPSRRSRAAPDRDRR